MSRDEVRTMACRPNIIELMHKVLDEDADEKDKYDLTLHLNKCRSCRDHFEELKKTEVMVRSVSRVKAPNQFKENILDCLPSEKRASVVKRWLQSHPVLTAAALFMIFMTGYLFSLWQGPQEVALHGTGHVITGDDEVIVPKGEV
ncbi:MAG TPA: anti-sigma factor, partial [Bacillales bacterium]|nr:anti-sigma factor [Bacillales bacterium]